MGEDASARNRVREVATTVPEPWTDAEIADAAGVRSGLAERCLERLVEQEVLVAANRDRGRVYFPDPVTSYVEYVGGGLDDDPERVAAVREAVAGWRALSEVPPGEIQRYAAAGRLVASSRLPSGANVYDADWDVLVVLDTCRIDALEAVADRLDGLTASAVTGRLSRGSQTAEWLCGTFTRGRKEAIARTGYVSGNGWAKAVFEEGLRPDDEEWFESLTPPTVWNVVNADGFGALVHAWDQQRGAYSPELPWAPHPPPRTVTDHAIALARNREDLDRLVVHYKQPHAPYTVAARRSGRSELTEFERAPFDFLAAGGNPKAVEEAYLTDLRAAVDEVEALCRNVDGRIVVTADHGEAFGEFGRFGHRPAMLHPHVRTVPWATLSANDKQTRDPDLSTFQEADHDIGEHLAALGYR